MFVTHFFLDSTKVFGGYSSSGKACTLLYDRIGLTSRTLLFVFFSRSSRVSNDTGYIDEQMYPVFVTHFFSLDSTKIFNGHFSWKNMFIVAYDHIGLTSGTILFFVFFSVTTLGIVERNIVFVTCFFSLNGIKVFNGYSFRKIHLFIVAYDHVELTTAMHDSSFHFFLVH